MLHEVSHVFFRELQDTDPGFLQEIEEHFDVKNGQWDREAREAWVDTFLRYLREGEAPTPELQTAFERFRAWLVRIYRSIAGTRLDKNLTPELRQWFGKLLTGEEDQVAAQSDKAAAAAELPALEPPPAGMEMKDIVKDIRDVKKRIRYITGQVTLGEVAISEASALKSQLIAEARAARKAFSEGRKLQKQLDQEKAKTQRDAQRERLIQDKWDTVKDRLADYRERVAEQKANARMRQEFNKIIRDLKKVEKRVDRMSPQEAGPIIAILNALDLTRMTDRKRLELEATRDWLANHPETELPEHVMLSLSRLDKTNVSDLTLDDMRDIHTAVMHYVHLNTLKNKIKVRLKRLNFSRVLNTCVAEMKPAKETDLAVSSQWGKWGKVKQAARGLRTLFGIRHDHYDLIIESLAGPNSTMDKVLFQGVKEGVTKQLRYRLDTFRRFREDLGDWAKRHGIKDVADWMNEIVTIGRFELTRGERMAMYRHSLNLDNWTAIQRGGFGFRSSPTPDRIYQASAEELNALLESLTPAEKEFSGVAVDRLFDRQYEELAEVFYEKNGYPLPKVENYYPKEVHPLKLGSDEEKADALERLKGRFTRVGLEKGMLTERVGSKKPVYINSIAYDINKSVLKSAAYIGLELPLSEASKLLYNETFRAEISERYGRETWKEIEQALRDIAGDYKSYTDVERFFLHRKNRLAVAALGLNPFVMLKQLSSLPLYNVYVDARYLLQGAFDEIWHPKETEGRHMEMSPEYHERVKGGFSRDVADVYKEDSWRRLFTDQRSASEKFMLGIQLFDRFAVVAGMQGAVLQVLDEIESGKFSRAVSDALDVSDDVIPTLTPGDKMALAYRFADYVTERTQDTSRPEHRSSLSRGTPLEQMFTMFGTYTNQALNLMRRNFREAERNGDAHAYEKLAKSLVYVLLVDTMLGIAVDEIRNKIYGRDDKKEGLLWKLFKQWSGYFFFMRDIFASAISKIEKGRFSGQDVELPALRIANDLTDAMASGWTMIFGKSSSSRKKEAMNFVDKSVLTLTGFFGIPYQTPKALVRGATKSRKGILEEDDSQS
jgi:hypothetical protein